MQIDTQVIKAYVAQVQSIRHIEVRALEKGYLEKVYIDEGQYVKQGQLMFQIMPTLYQAEGREVEGRGQLRRDRVPEHQEARRR